MKKNNNQPILFSGIQPSGQLHIGNYIGAIKNWVKLQTEYDCLFSLVDLHAITVRQDPKVLRHNCYDGLALYIACGLDPEKNTIFCQSHVPAHSELAWVLNCYTHMGELNRMTQFKDKAQKHAININVGLFAYPVLMAADILLYNAKLVPVGADQKQHLELTRDVAIRFNNIHGAKIFTIPEHYIPSLETGGRIMGLQDPDKKMSSSDPNSNNFLALLDPPKLIGKKLKRAVTDSGKEVRFHESKPGVSNLLTIYSALTDKPIAALEQQYQDAGYGKFKDDLAETIIEFLRPIQQCYQELRSDESALNAILKQGADNARERAQPVLDKVHAALGFLLR
jgi:tryptophanyl-tRNA synthetase